MSESPSRRTCDTVTSVNRFSALLRIQFILNRNHVLHTFSGWHRTMLALLRVSKFTNSLDDGLLTAIVSWCSKQVDWCHIFERAEFIYVLSFFISVWEERFFRRRDDSGLFFVVLESTNYDLGECNYFKTGICWTTLLSWARLTCYEASCLFLRRWALKPQIYLAIFVAIATALTAFRPVVAVR